MFWTRKPKPIDASTGFDVATQIADRYEEYGLTEVQADMLREVAVKAMFVDEVKRREGKIMGRVRDLLIQWRSTEKSEHRPITDGIIADLDNIVSTQHWDYKHAGADDLHGWFSMSYAKFLCLPRVMMQKMPDVWQERMAHLLNEWAEKWKNAPDGVLDFKINQRGEGGRMAKLHPALTNYRYPDHETLDMWSRQYLPDFTAFCEAVRSLRSGYTDSQIAVALSGVDEAKEPPSEGSPFTWTMVDDVVAVLDGTT